MPYIPYNIGKRVEKLVSVNDPVTLVCNLSTRNPVKWLFKGDGQVQYNIIYDGQHTLDRRRDMIVVSTDFSIQLASAQINDSGTYICIEEDANGQTTILNVKEGSKV